MHDDEPTIKFLPLGQTDTGTDASASNETTIKIPTHMRRSMLPLQNGHMATEPETSLVTPLDSNPFSSPLADSETREQQQPDPELPVLEYEYVSNRPESVQPVVIPVRKRKKGWPVWVRVTVTILLLFLVIVGGTLAYGYYYFDTNVQQPLTKFIHPVSRSKLEATTAASSIPSDSDVSGRVWNILLLGSDNDGKYSFPAVLTQVMMIVHVDTINNSVSMVSIPRDSWVHVPEVNTMHKIDQAFFVGASQHNSFDDGVRLARLTIEEDYGITIDRYAWVGLDGFAKVIDTLGGLDIDVLHPVVDDAYPDDTGPNANQPNAYKRLYIAPGPQHLTGLEALEYVRSRHADLIGDIGRTQRQQQVLQALKQKLNLTSVLSNLPQLTNDLTGSVYTDLSEKEIISFGVFARSLDSQNIQRITLGPGQGKQDYGDLSTIYDPWAGSEQDIVIPHCENIQPLMNRIFNLGDAQSCKVGG
jgi:polyisoprenyl-teichoic acid--peptidoglycan teichoic acid transferase